MKDIEFKIIVPAYNSEKYIDVCIQSVIGQNYENYRLIIVDDGSSDNTLKLAESYADKNGHITVIHQNNMGQIMARTCGVNYALGDYNDRMYLLFLDADDELKPGSLNRIAAIINEYDCDLLMYRLERFDYCENKALGLLGSNTSEQVISKSDLYKKVLYNTDYNSLCCKAVSSEIVRSVDYSGYSALRYGEDLIQSLDYYKNAKRVYFTSEVFYRYRFNRQSVTGKVDFYRYPVDSAVRKATWDFVVSENVWSEDELNDYAQFVLGLLESKLVTLCSFKVPYADKLKVFDDILSDSFYSMLLNMNLKKSGIIRRLIKRQYRQLSALAKIKRYARRLLG